MAKKEEIEVNRLLAMSSVKALPVPKSTYVAVPSTPVEKRAPLQAFSPNLVTKKQSSARKVFNEKDSARRAASAVKASKVVAMEEAELAAELYEKRRTAVVEGGLIPVALGIGEGINLEAERRQTRSMAVTLNSMR